MKPGIYHQTFFHDDNCPTLVTRNMGDCKCKPEVKIEKSKGMNFSVQKMNEDRKNFLRYKAKYN